MPTTAERLRELMARAEDDDQRLMLRDVLEDCAEQIAEVLEPTDAGLCVECCEESADEHSDTCAIGALTRAITKELDK